MSSQLYILKLVYYFNHLNFRFTVSLKIESRIKFCLRSVTKLLTIFCCIKFRKAFIIHHGYFSFNSLNLLKAFDSNPFDMCFEIWTCWFGISLTPHVHQTLKIPPTSPPIPPLPSDPFLSPSPPISPSLTQSCGIVWVAKGLKGIISLLISKSYSIYQLFIDIALCNPLQ